MTTATTFGNAGTSDATVSGNYNALDIQLSAGVIGTTELANDAVTSAKIADGTIVPTDVDLTASGWNFTTLQQSGNNVLTTATAFSGDVSGSYNNLQLGSGVVGTNELADNAVTSAKIADGTIGDADISSSALISVSKLAPGLNDQILATSGGTPQWTNFPGWALTGNSGTNPSTHFIGTTDGAALQIKVNNQKSGWIDY